jgi:hypothetical protein
MVEVTRQAPMNDSTNARMSESRGGGSVDLVRATGSRLRWATAVLLCSSAWACGDVNAAYQRLADARHVAADLHVQFVKAAGASDRVVLADTDQASTTFAHEAETAAQAALQDAAALNGLLQEPRYTDEARLLDRFTADFAAYRDVDRRILALAGQNTNLKAQRLSFGAAQDVARTFEAALAALIPANPSGAGWSIAALAARAIAASREIQILQAPHIADPDDGRMTAIEAQMSTAAADARRNLVALGPLVDATSRPQLAGASRALDRLLAVNAQIVDLSRRNTNVRSLALALDHKRRLEAPCEQDLQALEAALARRGFPSGR